MHNQLTRYYRNALSKCAWLIALFGIGVHLAVAQLTALFGASSWLVWGASSLSSFGVISGLFLLVESQYRTRLWKLAYPEFDLGGRWSGYTEYQHSHVNAAGSAPFQPFKLPNELYLDLDCLGVTVRPTVSPTGAAPWYSLTADFDTQLVQIRYAYKVDYGGAPNFPPDATGYEQLTVDGSQQGVRPTSLTGTFAHCAQGQRPVLSGRVRFTREMPDEDVGGLLGWLIQFVADFGKPKV